MSGAAKGKPCVSKKLRYGRLASVVTRGVGSEDSIQDQIIIAPEIMSLILGHLDLRSLKKARLVCKSWVREAQAHMERRGIVRLHTAPGVQDFIDCRKKKTADLPHPFKSIEVCFRTSKQPESHPPELLIGQLSSIIFPSPRLIVITRLTSWMTPLDLIIPLILECSPTLEYLDLTASNAKPAYLPLMDSEPDFPKLQSLGLLMCPLTLPPPTNTGISFASIAAWIIRGCPQLEEFKFLTDGTEYSIATVSEFMLKVADNNIRNVKTLYMVSNKMSRAAFDCFSSIPFTRLQNLKMLCWPPSNEHNFITCDIQAIVATVTKAAPTLKTLKLSDIEDYVQDFAQLDFPICPNVQELTLSALPLSNNFVSEHFPSAQVLNAGSVEILLEDGWMSSAFNPLLNLNTLKIENIKIISTEDNHNDDSSAIRGGTLLKLLERLPSLERLGLKPVNLLACYGVKSGDDPQVLDILEGIKHLELLDEGQVPGFDEDSSSRSCDDYSFLAAFRGVETIKIMEFDQAVMTLPVRELPFLKLIQFPWVLRSDSLGVGIDKLVEIAKGVEKVAVAGCCSIPRIGDQRSKELLEMFFDLAPNAECGCTAHSHCSGAPKNAIFWPL